MALTFSNIDKTSQGEYVVDISAQAGGPVFHQLNNVTLTIDASQGDATIKGDLSSLGKFNDEILEYANGHSEDWFGRKVAEATLAKAYQVQDDGPFTADLLQNSDSEVITKYYGQDKELKDAGELSQEDLHVHVVVELRGLWFVKKNFGAIWKLVQVKDAPPPPPKSPYEDYLFQDE